jgi:hypothetical protein
MPLLLCDLIKLAGVDLGDFKVHLATGEQNPPLAAFFDGKFEEWQEYQHQRNFQCEHVVGLIHLGGPRWLFAGVWKVHGAKPRTDGPRAWFEYDTTEVAGLEHLAGRVIVDYARTGRNSYRIGPPLAGELVVGQILDERMRMADFGGYASVLLSFDQLRHVVSRALPSWKAALASVAGVYLVADTSCGKLYVGSAYGAEGIWGRWGAYAETGTRQQRRTRQAAARARGGAREALPVLHPRNLRREGLRRGGDRSRMPLEGGTALSGLRLQRELAAEPRRSVVAHPCRATTSRRTPRSRCSSAS